MQTLNAADNPALANSLIQDIINNTEQEVLETTEPDIEAPSELVVDLPGGHVTTVGEIINEAEVRELTGRDEEAAAKANSIAKTFSTVIQRGVVRIGSEQATQALLDSLLAGDRDYLMLHIYAATFGNTLEAHPYCGTCDDRVDVTINLLKDVPVKRLESAYDRNFTVECSAGTVEVSLPTGQAQLAMLSAADKNFSELSTILLSETVTKIGRMPVMGPAQILDLTIRDRRKISEEIIARNPGPQFQDTTVTCPMCASTLEVPLSLAALFQF